MRNAEAKGRVRTRLRQSASPGEAMERVLDPQRCDEVHQRASRHGDRQDRARSFARATPPGVSSATSTCHANEAWRLDV